MVIMINVCCRVSSAARLSLKAQEAALPSVSGPEISNVEPVIGGASCMTIPLHSAPVFTTPTHVRWPAELT